MSKEKEKSINYVVMVVVLAMLAALQIVLERFLSVVNTPQLRIGFAFVPIVIASYMYGLKGGVSEAVVADIIGAVVFPTSGAAFFPGFTLTAAFNGAVFGIFLGKKSPLVKNGSKSGIMLCAACSAVLTQFVGGLVINTFWISKFITHTPFMTVFVPRIIQSLVMTAVEIVIIPIIMRAFSGIKEIQ